MSTVGHVRLVNNYERAHGCTGRPEESRRERGRLSSKCSCVKLTQNNPKRPLLNCVVLFKVTVNFIWSAGAITFGETVNETEGERQEM